MIGIIYVSLSGLLIGSGLLWLIFKARTQERVSLKQRFRKLLSRFVKKKAMINLEDDNIVKGTHYHLSLKHYNYVRYGVSAIILASGITAVSSTIFIAAIVFFLASWPQEKFGDMIKLPFYYFCRTIRTIDKDRKDMELVEVLSLLKNMTVQLRNNPLGADYIIEYLAANVDLTKSAFLKMLNQMRLNRMREAEQYFEEEIGTPLAKDVARILLQLDKLNPAEQEEMLVSIQRQIREAKTTVQKARTELMCDLVMIPASITVMLLFINFIVVVMGIDQLNQFQNLM